MLYCETILGCLNYFEVFQRINIGGLMLEWVRICPNPPHDVLKELKY